MANMLKDYKGKEEFVEAILKAGGTGSLQEVIDLAKNEYENLVKATKSDDEAEKQKALVVLKNYTRVYNEMLADAGLEQIPERGSTKPAPMGGGGAQSYFEQHKSGSML
jgi:hypothetical protein